MESYYRASAFWMSFYRFKHYLKLHASFAVTYTSTQKIDQIYFDIKQTISLLNNKYY